MRGSGVNWWGLEFRVYAAWGESGVARWGGETLGEEQEGESVSERPDSPDELDEAAGEEPENGESEQG